MSCSQEVNAMFEKCGSVIDQINDIVVLIVFCLTRHFSSCSRDICTLLAQ
jgi:hypothetical protein